MHKMVMKKKDEEKKKEEVAKVETPTRPVGSCDAG